VTRIPPPPAVVRRWWTFALSFIACAAEITNVVTGDHLRWSEQLLWIALVAGWTGVAALKQHTIDLQRQTIEILQKRAKHDRQRGKAWLS
jgi:hypothetical protein